jgi:hypothetical protein
MRIVRISVEGVSPLTFGKHYEVPKLSKEAADHYEERTWREKLHTDKEGQVIISAPMWKNCLRDTAAFLSMPIKGKGKSTYTNKSGRAASTLC